MLRDHLRIALRSLRKRPAYTALNVGGLAVGIATCLLIGLYVADELSYDRFFPGADRIVRVTTRFGDGEPIVNTPSVVAPLFTRSFPEIVAATRLFHATMFGPFIVQQEERRFEETRFVYGDSTTFDVFAYPFLAGSAAQALTRPHTVVLTATTARRYFGDENPLGRTLLVNGSAAYEVTGVIADPPSHSHLQFDFLASLVTRRGWSQLDDEQFAAANFQTYLRFSGPAAIGEVAAKLPHLVERQFGELLRQNDMRLGFGFQRLTEIHLVHEGARKYVYIFTAIGLLILAIACINFMNLATARSLERAKEVGVRKSLGASRHSLVRQFLVESMLLTAGAVVLAGATVPLVLPLFRELTGKPMPAAALLDPGMVLVLLGLVVVIGLLAGSYPAFALSRFQPVDVLKGAFHSSSEGRLLRRALVVGQFAVVIFLIAGTLLIQRQLDFVRTKDLGFDREQVVVLSANDRQIREAYEAVKQEIASLPGVLGVAGLSSVPGHMVGGYSALGEGRSEQDQVAVTGIQADPDVLEALGIELAAGRGLPEHPGYTTEQGYHFLVNETTARRLGWSPEEAVGKRLQINGRQGEIAGVMHDFHFASLHDEIGTLVFWLEPGSYAYFVVKLAPGSPEPALRGIEDVWARVVPHRPFTFEFLDRQLDALYAAESRAGAALGAFSLIAILVACLGLFGLAAFATEQRTKEVGIRKVLGASTPHLLLLLSREFVALVACAFLLAAPLAYLAGERWLANFAYRTSVGWDLFAAAGLLSLVLALATVSYYALRAATSDPVRALRYE